MLKAESKVLLAFVQLIVLVVCWLSFADQQMYFARQGHAVL
jgi:uncharacterized membrane protein